MMNKSKNKLETASDVHDQRVTFSDKCFKDKQGNTVLGQPPNKPLLIWFGAAVASVLLVFLTSITMHNGHASPVLVILLGLAIATAGLSIIVWALLELFQGINYFRRAIGLGLLLFLLLASLSISIL